LNNYKDLKSTSIREKYVALVKQKNNEEVYSHLFVSKLGTYPFRYLDIPMIYHKLDNKDRMKVEE
jgi:hypothetical protein